MAVSRDPFSPPKVKKVITATISTKDAEAYLEEGILLREDIQAAIKPQGDGEWCDVILRLNKQSEIKVAGVPVLLWIPKVVCRILLKH